MDLQKGEEKMPFPKLPIYLYILGALWIAALLFCLRLIVRKNAENDEKPILTVPVRLIKKKDLYLGDHHHRFLLFFLTENEELLEFNMQSQFEWDWYNEGDLGNLTYQGFRFIKFERTHINPPT